MPFVKVQKDKAYFKRYQVKYRRRRQGKTDYFARKRLVAQSKNKYNTPKYRLVVRFSNKYVLCQIVYTKIDGDYVLTSAFSKELKRYGLTVGLKNYSAAYCTGLLCARRLLNKLSQGVDEERSLEKLYVGTEEVTGEVVQVTDPDTKRTYFVDEANDDVRPFRCNLDVGLKPTTVGTKIFAALKGAVDGGLDIPHSEKCFPGYDPEEGDYDPEALKEKIFGGHVSEWMQTIQEEDEENGTNRYKELFGAYQAADVGPDDLEDLYAKVHAAIRADPTPKHAESVKSREYNADGTKKANSARAASLQQFPKQRRDRKISHAERKARVEAKKQKLAEYLAAQAEDEEED